MPDAPALPVVDRTTVPVSAIFSDAERAMPTAPTPASNPNDTVLPEPTKVAAPAAPAKPADELAKVVVDPAAAPAAPAKPADEPVKPVVDPAVTPAAPAPEAKVKIGDKEYTKQELEQALAQRTAAPAAPAPVAPVAEPAKPPTPEEIATAESKWCETFVSEEKLGVQFTEKELESVLTGDKDGVAVLSGKLNAAIAKAVLLARKSIYKELNPELSALKNNMQPVLQNQQQVEAAAAEHKFFTAYPDFKAHSDTVRRVGEALFARYPQELARMNEEQILAEVAAQSDRIIQAECDRFAKGKNWRQLLPSTAPAPIAVVPAPAPAPAVAPVVAAPAAAPAPTIRAPGANSPAATGTGIGEAKDWHKSTAASLAN